MDDFKFPWEDELGSGTGPDDDGKKTSDSDASAPDRSTEDPIHSEDSEKLQETQSTENSENPGNLQSTGDLDSENLKKAQSTGNPDSESTKASQDTYNSDPQNTGNSRTQGSENPQYNGTSSPLPDSSKGYFQQDDLGRREQEPYGNSHQNSYGSQNGQNAYGPHNGGNSYGPQNDGNSYGSQNTQNSYGSQNTQNSYGSQDGRNPGETQNNGYHSRYDSYRFHEPEDRRGTYRGGASGGGNRNGGNGKHRKNHEKGKKVGFVVALAAVFAVVFALVFAGASMLIRRSESTTTASSEEITSAASSAESSQNEVVLGNQDAGSESRKDSTAESAGTSDSQNETESSSSGTSDGELTTQAVVKKVMPSMVAITNVTVSEYQNIFGETQTEEGVSAGSGIIVGKTDDDLLIATNNHVISNSTDITVTFADDSAIAGSVKGTDADNDLAIVAVALSDIPEDTMDAVSIVEIGDSDALSVGESVVAIGNALGYGQSVSKGIVSALGRVVKDSDGSERELIQTDASINPGNSGGALLNMKGQLVGINEAKLVDESVEGVGYAIPMAVAEPILEKLGSNTARTEVNADQASYIGITCMTMPSSYTQNGYPEGAYVREVVSGGPADEAGIKVGDIITSMDGTQITSSDALINLLKYYAAGEQVEISVSRMNSDRTEFDKVKCTVTLGNRADMPSSSESTSSNATDGNSTDSEGSAGQFPYGGNDFYNYFFGR